MRLLPQTIPVLACLAVLPAQSMLRERVPDLLAHLSIPAGSHTEAQRLRELCTDPALAALAADEDWREPLMLLQGILARSTGEVELGLAALQPRADETDVPLLICRLQLSAQAQEIVQRVLARRDLIGRSRVLNGRAIYEIAGPGAAAGANPLQQVGTVVELLIDGQDLLISNSATALAAWVTHAPAEAVPPTSSADALDATLYVALDKLAPRLGRWFEGAADTAADRTAPTRVGRHHAFDSLGFWLGWSGLVSARDATLTLRPVAQGLELRIDVQVGGDGPDGWLAAAAPAADLDTLIAELPAAGAQPGTHVFATLAMTLDLPRLLSPRGPAGGPTGGGRLASMQGHLCGGVRGLGLDLEKQILSQLGSTFAVQLAASVEQGWIRPMFLLQTRSPKAAQRLIADLRGQFTRLGMVTAGTQPPVKGARTPTAPAHGGAPDTVESLHVSVPGLGEAYLAAVQSHLVCTPEPTLIDALRARTRTSAVDFAQHSSHAKAPFGAMTLDLRHLSPDRSSTSTRSSLLTRWHGTASWANGTLTCSLFAATPR